DVSGRCAVALIHVTAPNPLCTRRHPDLVSHAIVADRCTGGVRAMEEVVARKWRIVPARVADAIMDGVVPVVIVVGVLPVPTAVVRLKRIMGPANAGIGARNHDILARESQRPYLRRVGVSDSWVDCGWHLRLRYLHRSRLRQVVVDTRIAFYSRHVGTRGQPIDHLPCSPYQD